MLFRSTKLEDVRKAAVSFLKETLDVRHLTVTKLQRADSGEGDWEAEAEVYLPNGTIKALDLPVQNEILDCKVYLVRLDSDLSVTAYGLRDSIKNSQDQ